MPSSRGTRFYVPPAGDRKRTSRIIVRASRRDIDATRETHMSILWILLVVILILVLLRVLL